MHAWPSSRPGRAAWQSSRPGRTGPRASPATRTSAQLPRGAIQPMHTILPHACRAACRMRCSRTKPAPGRAGQALLRVSRSSMPKAACRMRTTKPPHTELPAADLCRVRLAELEARPSCPAELQARPHRPEAFPHTNCPHQGHPHTPSACRTSQPTCPHETKQAARPGRAALPALLVPLLDCTQVPAETPPRPAWPS